MYPFERVRVILLFHFVDTKILQISDICNSKYYFFLIFVILLTKFCIFENVNHQQMKKGQSVITLTFKEGGEMYLFGSLSAIYAMFTPDELGVSYASLRNAVSKYVKDNNVDEEKNNSQVIYDTRNSKIVLRRAPLLLADKSAE